MSPMQSYDPLKSSNLSANSPTFQPRTGFLESMTTSPITPSVGLATVPRASSIGPSAPGATSHFFGQQAQQAQTLPAQSVPQQQPIQSQPQQSHPSQSNSQSQASQPAESEPHTEAKQEPEVPATTPAPTPAPTTEKPTPVPEPQPAQAEVSQEKPEVATTQPATQPEQPVEAQEERNDEEEEEEEEGSQTGSGSQSGSQSEADDKADSQANDPPGRRKYAPDFLRSFRDSNKDKPEGLPDLGVIMAGEGDEDRKRSQTTSRSGNGRRRPNQGKDWNNNRQQAQVPVDEDATFEPLKKSESAWKPSAPTGQEEKILKAVLGILNKITPENFDELLKKIVDQDLNSAALREGVIEQIFQKAVMEQSFIVVYADLIEKLARALKSDDPTLDFRKMLIAKCQSQFTQPKPLEEVSDEVRAEHELKQKLKVLGNVRLIGELFKRKMLAERIMFFCFENLLQDEVPVEENLESTCKLMTTVGLYLTNATEVDKIFQKLTALQTNQAVSSRIRFMILDVIDLKNNNWKPRHGKSEDPKKLKDIRSQIEEEKKDKETQSRSGGGGGGGRNNYGKNDARSGGGGGGSGGLGNRQRDPGGNEWETQQRRRNRDDRPMNSNRGGGGRGFSSSGGGFKNDRSRVQEQQPPQSAWGRGAGAGARGAKQPVTPQKSAFANLRGDSDDEEAENEPSSTTSSPSASRNSSRANSPTRESEQQPEQSLEELSERLHSCFSQSEEPWDFSQLSELKDASYPTFVMNMISVAMEYEHKFHEKLGQKLVEIYNATKKYVKIEHLREGLESVVDLLPDLEIDNPKAFDSFSFALSAFVATQLLDIDWATKLIQRSDTHASKCLGVFLRTLQSSCEGTSFKDMIVSSSLNLKHFLSKNKKEDVDAFLKEYGLEDISGLVK
eukprot:c7850_g1_i2.p1 GENE.c7850_g1_i2~~c7850_g1_i2.p1  ORF type:complete len:899 (+),score=219.24 c7850_g1_i2:402-3098(+)